MREGTIMVTHLLLAGCAGLPGPPVNGTGGYSIVVTEGLHRRARAMEQAAQICAQETRNPVVMYVLEDSNGVELHFSCEGLRGAADVPPRRYLTLEKGINGLSEK